MHNLRRATASRLQHSKIATVTSKVAQTMFARRGDRGVGDGGGGEARR